MTLTSKPLAALVIALLFGGIFFSSAMGWWQTESTKEAAVFTTGEFAGQANPADIRGSYTFGDVERNFTVPAATLAQAFAVQTDDPATYQVKSLEELYAGSPQEVGTASVRLFVAFYLGLPFDLSTDIYLPESAAAQLAGRSLSSDQAAYLEAHTVPDLAPAGLTGEAGSAAQPASSTPPAGATPQTETDHTTSEDRLVKGKTTFAELLEWGLTVEIIEQVLGVPLPASPGIKVKDYCTEQSLNFETIKVDLQAEVDKVQ